MSLTSLIRSVSPEDKIFREIIRGISPIKSDFKTYSGVTAFSKYDVISEYNLRNSFESSLVGTSFDYLARITCSFYSKSKIEVDFMNFWIARLINEDGYEDIYDYYYLCEDSINEFLDSNSFEINDRIINSVFFLAKLDCLFKSGFLFTASKSDILEKPSLTIYSDLYLLVDTFHNIFVKNNIIKFDSLITYSPDYSGLVSSALGGIEADICIDGTLYDFKCAKKTGFSIQDSIQITAYYIFYLIDKILDSGTYLERHKIDKIAFYKARYGQIEYFDLSSIDPEKLLSVIVWLDKKFNFGITENKIKKIIYE